MYTIGLYELLDTSYISSSYLSLIIGIPFTKYQPQIIIREVILKVRTVLIRIRSSTYPGTQLILPRQVIYHMQIGIKEMEQLENYSKIS